MLRKEMKMHSRVVTLIAGAVLLTILAVKTGEAVSCYNCNSKTDAWCADPFDKAKYPAVDCSNNIDNYNLTYTRCLKMTQTVNSDYRVIRSCATSAQTGASVPGCISRTGTANVKVSYCACVDDSCNAAIDAHPSSSFAVAVSVAMLSILRQL